MIAGTGVDLVEINRLKDIIARRGERFIERIFTPAEKAYCEKQKEPSLHFAARWAAKESCLKALGLGIGAVGWKEMEVVTTPSGKPELRLSGKAGKILKKKGIGRLFLSLSHTCHEAVAVVILERESQ